jgi:hypothetical protein
MDSRKYAGIPRAERILAFGTYERLCDLIGQFAEWDELVGSSGAPWTLEQIADKCCLEPDTTRRIIDLLAANELIDADAWRLKQVVKIPAIIARAADWFRRNHRARVEEHLRRYGLCSETTGDSPENRGGSPASRGGTAEAPQSLPGVPPPTERNGTARDGTRRRRRRGGPDAPRNRIGFDVKTAELTGILPADVAAWKAAFPLVNVEAQLPRIANYLRDHESRDISATIRNWLQNEQNDAEAGRGRRVGATGPPPRSKDRWAGRNQGRVR